MNINFKQRALQLALVSAFALGASALGVNAYAASATATATATVIAPIGITKDLDMVFGQFSVSATTVGGGTVVMDTDGARTTGGSVLLSTMGGSGTAAEFTVTGDSTATYAITLPANATLTDGTNNMTVDNFLSAPSGTGALAAGTGTVTVGGTLNVAMGQVAGDYTGTFDVTVEYN